MEFYPWRPYILSIAWTQNSRKGNIPASGLFIAPSFSVKESLLRRAWCMHWITHWRRVYIRGKQWGNNRTWWKISRIYLTPSLQQPFPRRSRQKGQLRPLRLLPLWQLSGHGRNEVSNKVSIQSAYKITSQLLMQVMVLDSGFANRAIFFWSVTPHTISPVLLGLGTVAFLSCTRESFGSS